MADETTEQKLARLGELREETLHQAKDETVARRREEGKLTARERLEQLLDPGSFVELDRYVRHREVEFGMRDRRPWGDAVVTGYGTIFGRKVFVFSQDFTIFGGSLSEVFAEKICKVMDLAVKFGCPVIGINDSGGARIQEGVVSLAGYAEIFWRNVQSSGVVPQLSLVMGPCAGGAVYSPAITDFVFMVEGSSYMFITGPDVVKTVTGEEVTFEELGGASTHATKSGVAHFTSPDEEACLEDARYLLSFLPQNNLDRPPFAEPSDPRDRESQELDALIPDEPTKPYDMKQVDPRTWSTTASSSRCTSGSRRTSSAGSHGSAGTRSASSATSRACSPACSTSTPRTRPARFVRTCDAFNIPIVTFVDVPGLPARHRAGVARDHPPRREAALRVRGGDRAEADRDHAQGLRGRLRRHGLEAHPRGLQLRLADGGDRGHGPGRRGQHRLPSRARGGMDAARREELITDYKARFANPYVAAERGYVDDVIEPRRTRPVLIDALETASTKRERRPPRKHGNIPL